VAGATYSPTVIDVRWVGGGRFARSAFPAVFTGI